MLRSRGTTEPGAASLEVTKMRRRHLRGVMAIERQAYARPWTPNLFVAEMSEPNNRNYLVARIDKDVVGYAGLICYGDEAHITNIAARAMGAVAVSLEVRVTNWRAQRVYARFGFHPVGIRRNYYAELHEDALIMWTDDIRERAFRQRVATILHGLPEGIRPRAGAR